MTDRAQRLRDLVASPTAAAADGGLEFESLTEEVGSVPINSGDVTDRVEDTLKRIPDDEIGDPRDFRRALHLLLDQTRRTTERLADPTSPLTPDDEPVLEAIVRTDGTRPSLLVRDGAVNADHPLAGAWTGDFSATQERLRPAIAAVGRLEPANATARNYYGTGWVVDSDAGLVLTNQHVLVAIWKANSQRMQRVGDRYRVTGGVFIDFIGESGATTVNRFKVVEATPSRVGGNNFAKLDASVLRIEPTEDSQPNPPKAIRVVADQDGPRGNLASSCVVGFPAAPRYSGGNAEGVDWAWVNQTLFGNRFGVKRLAPGVTHKPLGSLGSDDPHPWVFGHDMTTLGGNSGSPILNWFDENPGGFGLHFAGLSVESNYAHAIAAAAADLAAMGVPVVSSDNV